ncbi:hypothetical protein GCM10027036_23200 [Flavihumibacter cheonanensis]
MPDKTGFYIQTMDNEKMSLIELFGQLIVMGYYSLGFRKFVLDLFKKSNTE